MDQERPRRRAPLWGLAALAAAIAVAAFVLLPARESGEGGEAGRRAGMERPAAAVTLEKVELQPIEQTLTAIGTGRAVQSLTLNAEVSGVIRALNITPGARVEKGFPLVELEREQQEIALAKARADYAIARTNAQRFEGLVADEAASALENESAQNTLIAAQAELKRAEFELSQRTIRAPFAGVLGLTDLDVGDYLSVGATVTTIDDVTSLLVDFVIPETASGYVREGLAVRASAAAAPGRTFEGVIRAVDSRIDPASRTRRVEAVLENEDLALVPGATFSINLAVPGRLAAKVSGLAVQWDRSGSFVWRRSANGVAQRMPATILKRTGEAVLVDAALEEDEYIVAEGADLVRPGMALPEPDRRGSANYTAAGGAAATD